MSGSLKIAIVAVLLLLLGCSARQLNQPRPGRLILLPPAEAAGAILLKQTVTLLAGQRQQQFLVVARFEPNQLKMVVLLPTGQRLMSLDYDGENLVQETLAPIDVPGREILAIIQFAMWPGHSIKNHYSENDGWTVEITPEKRILFTATGARLKISYHSEELIVDNYIQNYRVIVHTLERIEL